MLGTQSGQQQKGGRKYQYYTGASTTNSQHHNNNIASTMIDQHRNSIQQRITNLQSKISQVFCLYYQLKKYHQLAQSRKDKFHSNNNVMSNYKSSTVGRNNQLSSNSSKLLLFSGGKYQTMDAQWKKQVRDSTNININTTHKLAMSKQQQQTKQTITPPYPSSSQSIITKHQAPSNKHHLQHQSSHYRSHKQTKGYTPATSAYQRRNDIESRQRNSSAKYNYLVKDNDQSNNNSRMININDRNHKHKHHDNSNNYYETIDIKSTPKLDHYYQDNRERSTITQIKTQAQSLPKQQQHIQTHKLNSLPNSNNNIQQQFTHLSKTISSLRKHSQLNDKFTTTNNQHDTNHNKQFSQKINNVQLYQMMKIILIGQQRLQKQLQIIKNKQSSTTTNQKPSKLLQIEHIYNTNIADTYPLTQKPYTNPKITQTEYKIPNNYVNSVDVSPLLNKNKEKSQKSPTQKQKNTTQKENHISRQGSNIKQRKCHSAVQSKNKPNKSGKITKNKQQFYQLYKQAQRQKRLSPLNTRLTISQQTKSSIWDRIKSVIQRSQQQDAQSSRINHQNNRYINDHLVNTIQLQKRLKGDLVKKVYDMCENKCLYK